MQTPYHNMINLSKKDGKTIKDLEDRYLPPTGRM
jgi:hypothetical protein